MAGSDDWAQAEQLYKNGKNALDTGDKDEAKSILAQALDLFTKCIQGNGLSYSAPPPDAIQKKQEIEGILSRI